MTKSERRAVSAAWRVLQATDDITRNRALYRLQALTDEVTAFEFWLLTKPDPADVRAYLDYRLLKSSMRPMIWLDTRGLEVAQQFQTAMNTLQREAGQAAGQLEDMSRAILAMAEEEV